MNELHARLQDGGPEVAAEIKVIPFEGEVTLPLYTRINGEEVNIGEVTVPVKLNVDVTYKLPEGETP
jgi:hypothetical protein